jgi:ankyrin repeat protein
MVKLLLDKGAKLEDTVFYPQFEQVNFQIIKYLLKRGANPTATYYGGDTLLHTQCYRGNLKNAKYLINHYNADFNAKNDAGQTPLHFACTVCNKNLKIVKFLIEEQKAEPGVTCNEGKSALHYTAETIFDQNILRYLIEVQQLDIEATDNEGRTALHIACESDNLFVLRWETQKYLIEDHAKIIEAKDKEGKTALYYCLANFVGEEKYEFDNFRPIALILATKANILKKQENKDTDHIFDWIKQSYDKDMKKSKGEDEAVSCLNAGLQSFQKQLDKKDLVQIEYNPLLLLVCYCNTVDIAKYMFNQDLYYIEKHFNAEEANSNRKLLLKSYLKFSCENDLLGLTKFLFQEVYNKQEFFEHFHFDGSFLKNACENKHFKVFKYLLEDEKAKDEAAEFLKDFPLHYVCKNGSLEMVQYLIETKQVDIEEQDNEGRTPLHCACLAGSIEISQYLIEKQNANINTSDNIGRAPLHSACIIGSIEIVKYLIENQNANIDTINNKGISAWHFACLSGCLELVKYISQKTKLDVNSQDEDGSTALHLACEHRRNLKGQYITSNLKLVKYLITDMKADLHSVDNEGRTPLHVHCQSRWPEVSIAKFLVNQGASVLAKDKSRKAPLQIAKSELINPEYEPAKVELITFLQAATKR